jgi:hypothetical protein
MKGFFKALAVKEMRTFGIILARMIPMHVTTNNLPTYLTEEQMRAELRAPAEGVVEPVVTAERKGPEAEDHTLYASHTVWESRSTRNDDS